MDEYFDMIEGKVKKEFDIASTARAKGYDPVDKVDIPLAISNSFFTFPSIISKYSSKSNQPR